MESENEQNKETSKEELKESHHHTYPEQEEPIARDEFPSVGHFKTDFVTRDHGRTSHRMIDHEPGSF